MKRSMLFLGAFQLMVAGILYWFVTKDVSATSWLAAGLTLMWIGASVE